MRLFTELVKFDTFQMLSRIYCPNPLPTSPGPVLLVDFDSISLLSKEKAAAVRACQGLSLEDSVKW